MSQPNPPDPHANQSTFSMGTDWLWLGLVLMLAMAVAALMPIAGVDYWYYLRVGSDTVTQGAVPQVDTYSWSQAGQPYIYYSWLSAVVLAGANALGGATLTVALRVVSVALTFTILWLACKESGASPRLSALVVLVAAAASSNNLTVRPQLLIYPLFALTLLILSRWHNGDRRWVWAFIPMAVLWVNLHASFVLLFLLGGAALLIGAGDRRRLAIALAVSAAALLVNPRLDDFLHAVGNLLSSPSVQKFATEWQPPNTDAWQTTLFFAWLIAFPLIASFSAHETSPPAPLPQGEGSLQRKISRHEWLWIVGLGWLALNQGRSVVWWVLVMTPVTARLLTPLAGRFTDRASRRGIPALNAALFALMLILPFGLLPGIRVGWWTESPPAIEPSTPVGAVAFLKDHPDLPGPLWADAAYGSYLIYALPERPVWIDPRIDLYPVSQWEDYFATAAGPWDWEARLDRNGVNLLMLSRQGQPELLKAVSVSLEWKQEYNDVLTLIYSRVRPVGAP